MHDTATVDEDTMKPEIILDYNGTKGGVDTVDKMCASYSVSRITRRWPLALFFTFLNIAGINSQIIFSFNNPDAKLRRRLYLKNLALGLMKEHMIMRSNIVSLPADITVFLSQYCPTKRPAEDISGPKSKVRGTCFICGRKKNSSTSMKCGRCSRFSCKQHSRKEVVCEKCTENNS